MPRALAAAALVSAALVTAAVMTLGAAGAAGAAECPAVQEPSATVFTGTVTDVKDGGTLAVVRRQDGSSVLVSGVSAAGLPPRTWAEGARYEFHPRGGGSPFADDGCSATRLVSPAPASRGSLSRAQLVVGVAFLALLLSTPALARRLRRRAHRPPADPET